MGTQPPCPEPDKGTLVPLHTGRPSVRPGPPPRSDHGRTSDLLSLTLDHRCRRLVTSRVEETFPCPSVPSTTSQEGSRCRRVTASKRSKEVTQDCPVGTRGVPVRPSPVTRVGSIPVLPPDSGHCWTTMVDFSGFERYRVSSVSRLEIQELEPGKPKDRSVQVHRVNVVPTTQPPRFLLTSPLEPSDPNFLSTGGPPRSVC